MPRSRAAALILVLLLTGVGLVVGTLPDRPAPQAPPPGIMGRVVDEHGPVAGVLVRFKSELESWRTDGRGRFHLPGREGTRVTAWKDGHLIAGGSASPLAPLTLSLEPLPAEDCELYRWVDPTPDRAAPHNCGNCHGEIYREWLQSGHARSATGRHFRNLYDGSDWEGNRAGWSLLDEHPDGAGVCTACHAPTVPAGDPAYFDLRQVKGVAAWGVHCDYCHKIQEAGLGQIGLTHGRFGLKLLRPAEGQLFFGPLDDVDRGEDVYSPLYRQSRYCASCHEGTVFGVHVYGTYSEWLSSPARRQGRHCQDCHTTPTGLLTNIAPGHGGIERDPWTLGNHRFFAGSQEEMLRRCLRVTAALARDGDAVRAEVTVCAEDVGHCVPTGFIDRHLLLIVEALDGVGLPLRARTGPLLPDAAGEPPAGRPGKLYGKLLKDVEGRGPAPFWRAQPTPVDTRLRPEQPDRSVWTFPASAERLRVRLVYRRFWHEVAVSKGWPENEIAIFDREFPN
jgi:hypothetical protein